ncbi:MAG: adenine phosphoribosyltransferase [Sneathiella sp.]|jgi:adenine phosphoribosyltransferase|uniref:adenine phosphoribosyltransferase n=1 Tax=Sneathiella sp. TaxID=1964365 RepID=UPI000C41E1E5|nr:adenine phosphoribosyltransferase [Sneathiella sp.]MAL80350.1 adenine phosphoribosyltransferase [Sneathiella sp.]
MDIKSVIRTIPDYPHKGIMFRDITTLWQDASGFRHVVDQLVWPYAGVRIDKVAGIEARGFVLGGAIAHQLSVGFIPVRKKGKLPSAVLSEEYDLEYGTDTVEVHQDAIKPGENILLVDDLIATGGTACAAISLIRRAGGTVIGAAFVIDLPDIGGSRRLTDMGVNVRTLCEFEGD